MHSFQSAIQATTSNQVTAALKVAVQLMHLVVLGEDLVLARLPDLDVMEAAGVSGWKLPGWISITLPISQGQVVVNKDCRFIMTRKGDAAYKKSARPLLEADPHALTQYSITGRGIGHTFLPPSIARDFLLAHGTEATKAAMLQVGSECRGPKIYA